MSRTITMPRLITLALFAALLFVALIASHATAQGDDNNINLPVVGDDEVSLPAPRLGHSAVPTSDESVDAMIELDDSDAAESDESDEAFLEDQSEDQLDAEDDAEAEADAEDDAEVEDDAEADEDAEVEEDAETETEGTDDEEARALVDVSVVQPWYPQGIKKAKKGMKSGPAWPANPKNIPFRIVLHSTEGSTHGGAEDTYVVNGGINPHFTVGMVGNKFEVHQHVPITHASRSLAHGKQMQCQTNNAYAIQIEMVGNARDMDKMPPAYQAGVADLLAWIQQQTKEIDPKNYVKKVAAPFYWSPKSMPKPDPRFDCPRWEAFSGVCGHQHVPGNSHIDPGMVPIGALMAKMV